MLLLSLQIPEGSQSIQDARDRHVEVCRAARERNPDIEFAVRPLYPDRRLVLGGGSTEKSVERLLGQAELTHEIGATTFILRVEDGCQVLPESSREAALSRVSSAIKAIYRQFPEIEVLVENTVGGPSSYVGSLPFLLLLFDHVGSRVCFNPAVAWSRGESMVHHEEGPLSESKLSQIRSFCHQMVRAVVLQSVPRGVEFGSFVEDPLSRDSLLETSMRKDFMTWMVNLCWRHTTPLIIGGHSDSKESLDKNLQTLMEWSHG